MNITIELQLNRVENKKLPVCLRGLYNVKKKTVKKSFFYVIKMNAHSRVLLALHQSHSSV